jgi:hypothetical protein
MLSAACAFGKGPAPMSLPSQSRVPVSGLLTPPGIGGSKLLYFTVSADKVPTTAYCPKDVVLMIFFIINKIKIF